MYSHILFDMDDTILDFQKAQFVSIKYVLAKYNIPYSDDIYHLYKNINHNLWGQFDEGKMSKDTVQQERFTRFFKTLGEDIDGQQANIFYQDALAGQTWLIPYAKEICKKLSQNHTLSIVTNGVGMTQKKRFSSSEISPYFSNILISEDIGIAKPDKRFFDEVFKVINCAEKSQILWVGDSLSSDIQGANNAGIDCCWFNPKCAKLDRPLQITYTITDLRQLSDIV